MTETLFIWISRWEDFQHYKPERDRGPAWIKQHVAQLHDERYLNLTMVQRALLHDLRLLFSAYRGRLSSDTRALTHKIGHRVTSVQLEALNHAGLIDLCSREVLDQRLEKLYTYARAPARSREVEEEVEPPLPPASAGGDNQPTAKKTTRRKRGPAPPLERALAFTRNAGHQYEPSAYEDELARYGLGLEEHAEAMVLYDELRARTNGAQAAEDLPWEGEEPPVIT